MQRGIDVSSYQGVIDWKKVKGDGVDFAILKVIRKDLNPDKQFEANWKGCEAVGMPVHGVYNYSYATTVSKAAKDAQKVLEVLGNRKCRVYLDVEDACQKNLGRLLIDIINTYGDVIRGAGLEFGVYTGLSFYNTFIRPYGGVSYPLWIARYGNNDGALNEAYKPSVAGMVGWQYTSKAKVSGISGNVDMNVWYEELETVAKNETVEKPKKSVEEIAKEVIAGKWGSGDSRKKKLASAGYDYATIQTKVNEMLTSYYPKYTGTSKQIDVVFKAIGVPAKFIGNRMKRKPIAEANGITGYTGKAAQNLSLIALAKAGKLKKV